jgi:hypothetical protein
MKVNLVKELEKNSQENAKKAFEGNQFMTEDVLNQANQLLLAAHDEDREVLETLGIKHLKFEKKLVEDVVRSKKVQAIYNKPTFSGKDLKYFCNMYDLKVLPISYYSGAVPAEFARIVREFCTERGTTVKNISDNLFVMAPAEMFDTIKHKPKKKVDPILLYRDTEKKVTSYRDTDYSKASTDDMFVQVYNWGNDFNFTRKYHYLFTSTIDRSSDTCVSTVTFWAIVFMLIGFVLGMSIFNIGFGFFFFIVGSLFILFNSDSKFVDTLWNQTTR